jgi:hypothetical protein
VPVGVGQTLLSVCLVKAVTDRNVCSTFEI